MELANKYRSQVANYFEEVDHKGRVRKVAITDIASIWASIKMMSGGKIHRIASTPFFVTESGEITYIKSAADLFALIFSLGGEIKWAEKLNSGISKGEMLHYVGRVADPYDLITAYPHYPPMPACYYHRVYGATESGALDTLVSKFNAATPADSQLIKALFMTPFWGGPGGTRPAFLIDGVDNDPEGKRGIGKSTITDVLAHLLGGCVDITKKTDGDEIKKQLLTSKDTRLVRMDNIKSGSLSHETIESLITIRRVNGHRMYIGHSSIENWFTYCLTMNDATLSKDMAQRCMIIRVKRPKYDANWFTDITRFVDENKRAIIEDIGFNLQKNIAHHPARTRFALWEREVLARACMDLPAVLDAVAKEQRDADTDNQIAEDIEEICISRISKLYRFEAGSGEKINFNPETDVVGIKRSVVLDWVEHVFPPDMSRRALSRRFDSSTPKQFSTEMRTYLGDKYLIWNPGDQLTTKSCWRVTHSIKNGQVEEVKIWDFKNGD